MAQENEILVQVTAEVKQILAALKSIEKSGAESAKKTEDAFAKANKAVTGTFNTLKASIIGIAAFKGFDILKDALGAVVEAGIEADKTFNRFANSLRASGDASEETISKFKELATQISNVTGLDDDLILGQISIAKNLGLSNDQTERAIKAAVDLSAATGKDLNTSIQAISKSYLGYGQELGRILPQTRGFTEEQNRLGLAVDFVAKRFEDSAANFAQTLPGALQRLDTVFGNLKETIGLIILQNPAFVGALNTVSDLIIKLTAIAETNTGVIQKFVKSTISVFATVFNAVQSFVKNVIVGIDFLVTGIRAGITIIKAQLQSLADVFVGVYQAIKTRSLDPLKKITENVKTNFVDAFEDVKQKVNDFAERTIAINEFSAAIDESVSSVTRLDKTLKGLPKAKGQDGFVPPVPKHLSKEEKKQAEKDKEQREKLTLDLATSLTSGIAEGAEGARKFVTAALTTAAIAFLGPIGQALGPIFDLLTQGAAKVKEQVDAFFQALPEIIAALIEAIPQLIVSLAENLPIIVEKLGEILPEALTNALVTMAENLDKIMVSIFLKLPIAFAKAAVEFTAHMPKAAIEFSVALVKEMPQMAKEFVKVLIDELKKGIGSVFSGGLFDGGGGGVLGKIGGVVSGAASSVGSVFKKIKFAEGGIVPGGAPFTDRVNASLTPGELVVDRSTTKDLSDFLRKEREDKTNTDLLKGLLASGNQNINIRLQVGESELASVLLNLNRNGYRVA